MNGDYRILVADDHEMVLRGLRTVLESQAGWSICGEARNGREAVELALRLKPDLVVMDLTMPELNGLDATRQVLRDLPRTQVLILTMHESEQLIHEVLRAGARGFVLKSDGADAITGAVAALQKGQTYFTARVSELMLRSYVSPDGGGAGGPLPPVRLTGREREIVQLIAEGRSTKEVGAALGISVKTAETHRTNVMRKLGIHSVSELVRYAIRNRIIAP